MRVYPTERKAYMRVQTLRKLGIWPGIVRLDDGSYRLTFDPFIWELA